MVPDVPVVEDPAASNDDAVVGIVVSSARLAFVPVRVVARAPLIGSFLRRRTGALQHTGAVARREATERALSATRSALSGPEVRAIIDETLAGPLPEAVVRSAVEHHLAERIGKQPRRAGDGGVHSSAGREPRLRARPSSERSGALRCERADPAGRSFAEEMAATAHNRLVQLDGRSGRAAAGNEAGAASRPRPSPSISSSGRCYSSSVPAWWRSCSRSPGRFVPTGSPIRSPAWAGPRPSPCTSSRSGH